MVDSGSKEVFSNFSWNFLGKITVFSLKFVTVPILARLLTPEDFGAVAVALMIIGFLSMLGSGGLGASLIIQRGDDKLSYDTVFWVNVFFSAIAVGVLYTSSANIANFMEAPKSEPIIQALSLLVPLYLCSGVNYAILSKRMQFKADAFWSAVSEVVAALCAIYLAYNDFGVWALVWQQYISATLRLVGVSYSVRYLPGLQFSVEKLKSLWGNSYRLMSSDIIHYMIYESPLFFITKGIGLSAAGSFTVANNFTQLPSKIFNGALSGVLLPAFSKLQDDVNRAAVACIKSIRITNIILAPMMLGIWALSEPITKMMFGEQWLHIIPVIGLLALAYAVSAPTSGYVPYLKGMGFTSVLLRIALIRMVTTVIIIYMATQYGSLIHTMYALVAIRAVTTIGYSAYVFITSKLPVFSSMVVTLRPLALSAVMAVLVRIAYVFYSEAITQPIVQIIVGAALGAMLYAILLLLFEFKFIKSILLSLYNKSVVK
ncbi:MAG: lipopolysaccharide biosynthesis protein [Alphaproteobacteria bacterium]|nr:lipopolysaccharide biosynthesis protein [Alphaproteobacteria bacterium]